MWNMVANEFSNIQYLSLWRVNNLRAGIIISRWGHHQTLNTSLILLGKNNKQRMQFTKKDGSKYTP
jgi:hypothetical protein